VDPQIQGAFPIITSIESARKRLLGEKPQIELQFTQDMRFKSQLNQIEIILRNSIEYPNSNPSGIVGFYFVRQ
jgi:hypothetical protein